MDRNFCCEKEKVGIIPLNNIHLTTEQFLATGTRLQYDIYTETLTLEERAHHALLHFCLMEIKVKITPIFHF